MLEELKEVKYNHQSLDVSSIIMQPLQLSLLLLRYVLYIECTFVYMYFSLNIYSWLSQVQLCLYCYCIYVFTTYLYMFMYVYMLVRSFFFEKGKVGCLRCCCVVLFNLVFMYTLICIHI